MGLDSQCGILTAFPSPFSLVHILPPQLPQESGLPNFVPPVYIRR
jgi:hypothetical protein